MDRYWPGPLTLLLAGKSDEEVAVRQPAHAFTREVIQACGEPLWLTSIPDRTGTAMTDPAIIAARLQDDITLLVDDGESPLGAMSTLVRAIGPELEVLREGILSRAEVLQAAADLILFVCTGNTCRSPLAEAFARAATAQAMGVHEDRVLARGLRFASAGTAAMPGAPGTRRVVQPLKRPAPRPRPRRASSAPRRRSSRPRTAGWRSRAPRGARGRRARRSSR